MLARNLAKTTGESERIEQEVAKLLLLVLLAPEFLLVLSLIFLSCRWTSPSTEWGSAWSTTMTVFGGSWPTCQSAAVRSSGRSDSCWCDVLTSCGQVRREGKQRYRSLTTAQCQAVEQVWGISGIISIFAAQDFMVYSRKLNIGKSPPPRRELEGGIIVNYVEERMEAPHRGRLRRQFQKGLWLQVMSWVVCPLTARHSPDADQPASVPVPPQSEPCTTRQPGRNLLTIFCIVCYQCC